MTDVWRKWNRSMGETGLDKADPWRWNIGVGRWLSFGLLARIAWLNEGAEVPGISWRKAIGRLYWSDRRVWSNDVR